jgi:hypothetical protein
VRLAKNMTKIAILSDIHFGDPMCSLAAVDDSGNRIVGPAYPKFKEAVGSDLDYLVLVGDILDFSVASYDEAYLAAKPFFEKIASDGTLKYLDGKPATPIVYIPGNHDYDIWNQIEYEVNFIRPMHAGKAPRSFHWAVPGVFDLRKNTTHSIFELPQISKRDGDIEYGGLFLDKLTTKNNEGEGFPFYIAYPNVYLFTDDFCGLITHGQYLEAYWSLLSEVAPLIAGDDLKVSDPPNIKEMVALNFPLSQLACSGVGQAGPLTKVVRQVQRDVKENKLERIEQYLDQFDNNIIEKMNNYCWIDPRRCLIYLCAKMGKKKAISIIKAAGGTRYDKEFLNDQKTRDRFLKYYAACKKELKDLCVSFGYNISTPTRVMYGHTHIPIPWGSTEETMKIDGETVCLNNFGGWLYSERTKTGGKMEGAEIVLIESGNIKSVRIG